MKRIFQKVLILETTGLIASWDKTPRCSSCLAFRAMFDCHYIFFRKSKNIKISAKALDSCSKICGFGCSWSSLATLGHKWSSNNSSVGCQPYLIKPCEHHVPGNRGPCTEGGKTPKCVKKCRDGYNKSYYNDKHYGSVAYAVHSDTQKIQMEIMKHGPVEGAITVYDDFLSYKSGKI